MPDPDPAYVCAVSLPSVVMPIDREVALERLGHCIRDLGRLPLLSEYIAKWYPCTRHALRRFWPSWRLQLAAFVEWAGERPEWEAERRLARMAGGEHGKVPGSCRQRRNPQPIAAVAGLPPLGEPRAIGCVTNAPLNEQGVVLLFGALATELGFRVLATQTAFPDCFAMRRMGDGRWRLARIEFELESRSFVNHGHDPAGCDLIVCWRHNWPDCPLEVLELGRG
jgi:hypothetical protein